MRIVPAVLGQVEREILEHEMQLQDLRDKYDSYDANQPHKQGKVMARIATVSRKLELLQAELEKWKAKQK